MTLLFDAALLLATCAFIYKIKAEQFGLLRHLDIRNYPLNYLRIAATPGSSLPSIYSSRAPPPVET